MLDPIDFRERALTQEAFHFIGVPNSLALFERVYKRKITCLNSYQDAKCHQSLNGMDVSMAHSGLAFVRGAPARNTRNENPR
jgi:hypothetical protein